MSCPSYSLFITRYLDDALNDEERAELLLHLSQCPECRWTLARYRRLDAALRIAPAARPHTGFRRNLLRRAEGRLWPFASLSKIWSPALAVVPVIVAVLVAAAVILPALNGQRPDADNTYRDHRATLPYVVTSNSPHESNPWSHSRR